MKTLIKGGTIVNEGKTFKADLVIENDRIAGIPAPGENTENYDVIIDATGQYIIPGVIDDQVHFREPGLTHKGNQRCASHHHDRFIKRKTGNCRS